MFDLFENVIDLAQSKKTGGGELPFGETTTVKEVLAETVLDMPECYADGIAASNGFCVGDTVTVEINGVTSIHKAVALTAKDGNGDSVTVTALVSNNVSELNNETEWVILLDDTDGIKLNFESMTGLTTATISIRQEVATVQKISGKFVEGMGYVEKSVKEVLAECQPEFVEGEGVFVLMGESDIAVGEKYTVNWNGADYECVAVSAPNNSIALGNMSAMGGDNTGEPFLIAYNIDASAWSFIDMTGSTTLTISIRQETETIHPIDQKFLPSGGGGAFVVTLTMGATGVVSDKTGVEIGEAAKNGSVAIAILNANESLFVFTLQGFAADEAFATFGRFVLNDGDLTYESVTIQADGTVSMGGATVQTT